MPPQGLGRGRKWSVEVEVTGGQEYDEQYNLDDYWRIKAEINFTNPDFIIVVCKLNEIVTRDREHFLQNQVL
jgi:hypothetical protein